MSQVDFWYIRFPDGRVLRAASTTILRQELSARHIPLGSTVRRSPSDEWVSLEWTQEFADLVEAARKSNDKTPVPLALRQSDGVSVATSSRRAAEADADHPATVGSRLDASRLHLVGVRGYFDELLAALDSTLVPKKLLLGLIAGFLLGLLFVSAYAGWLGAGTLAQPMVVLLLVVGLLLFDGVCSLLTRLTYLELARLRPAHWRHGLRGLGRLTLGVFASKLLVWGILGAGIVLLRWLPVWLGPEQSEPWRSHQVFAAGSVLILAMIAEVLLYPLFVLWWLLPPILAVENCTVWRGLSQGLDLLRRNLGLAFLYQMMAVAVGALTAAPFLLLIAPLFLPFFYVPEALQDTAGAMRFFLLGLACAPLLTYWITANVFIYLNLQYGARGGR